jgi:hypothetical protein
MDTDSESDTYTYVEDEESVQVIEQSEEEEQDQEQEEQDQEQEQEQEHPPPLFVPPPLLYEHNQHNQHNQVVNFVMGPRNINLKCFPLCFHTTLSEEQLNEQECSDGIYVSSDRFQFFNMNDSEDLVIIKISNGTRSTYAQIVGFHNDGSDKFYMPPWMFQQLDVDCDDNVVLERFTDVSIGIHIKIKPHSSSYATLDDPVSELRNAFEKYIVLQSNTVIPLFVNGTRLDVSILDTHRDGPICIRGTELVVELDTPLDVAAEAATVTAVTTEAVTENKIDDDDDESFDQMFTMPTKVDTRFPGKGYVLGGKK